MTLMIQSWCPGTQCDPCKKHGKTATTPRISLSTGGVTGYDLGPTLWHYYPNWGTWGIVIVYDPNTGIYTIPPWNPAAIGAPPMPPIPPVPVYDSRNQVIAIIGGTQNLSIVQPLDNSLTYYGGGPTTFPPGPPPYPDIPGPGDWLGSVGQSLGGWIDPQQIVIPDNWWGWISGKISDQVLYVVAKQGQIDRPPPTDVTVIQGVGFGGGWSYSPQWDFNGTWVSTRTVYFYPDYLNLPNHA